MKGKGKKKIDENRVEVNGIEYPQPQPPKLYKDFYEVEAMHRKRLHKGQLQYLIKWLGWPERTNTWEPLENLQTVLDLVDDFLARLKSGICQNLKRRHVNPSQPAPPSIANPHIVKFADEEDTNADATRHASLED